jgi:hypothetical protein
VTPPSAGDPPERQGEAGERVAEGQQPVSDPGQQEHQTEAQRAQDKPTTSESEHAGKRYYKAARAYCERGLAWMRRDSAAIQAGSAVVVAFFTAMLYFVSNRQWNATRDANELTRRNIEISQRAWMVISGAQDFKLTPLTPATIKFELKNVGRTPATYVYTMSLSTGKRAADPFVFSYVTADTEKVEITSQSVVGPDQPLTLNIKVRGASTEQVNAIREKISMLYVYGYVEYWDEFGTKRGLTWCHTYKPETGTWWYCPTHNVPW